MLPVEISAPLLLRSPLITDEFLDKIIREKGDAYRKVIETRRQKKKGPGGFAEEAVRRKLERLATAPLAAGPGTGAGKGAGKGADMETLLAAVCVGHDVELASASAEESVADESTIFLSLALSSNTAFLATRLADRLGLSFRLVSSIMADPDGSEFATLLKAANTETATALAVVMILSGQNINDVDRIRLVYARYLALDAEDARAMIAGWLNVSEAIESLAAGNATERNSSAA